MSLTTSQILFVIIASVVIWRCWRWRRVILVVLVIAGGCWRRVVVVAGGACGTRDAWGTQSRAAQ